MKKTSLLFGTACATLITGAPFAFAQDSATNAPTPILGISKSAVGGSGTGTIAQAMQKKIPLKSQYAASHISKAEIEQASPVATAQEILNTEPSINATSSGPLGVEQNITLRSFNSAQFSQTYDGIALNDIFHGGTTNEFSEANNVLITTNDFDGVDIYRGINNPAVNSYNSLGGTINYDPINPTDKANGEVGSTLGSFHTFQYNLTFNTGDIHGVKQLFSFQRGTSSGWTDNTKTRNNNLYYALNAKTGNTGQVYDYFIYNQNQSDLPFSEPQAFFSANGRNFQVPNTIFTEPSQDTNFMNILGTTQTITPNITFDIKGFFGSDDFLRTAFSNPDDQKTAVAGIPDPFAGLEIPAQDINPVKGVVNPFTNLLDYGSTVGLQPSFTFNLPYDNTLKIGANYTLGHLHNNDLFSSTSNDIPLIPGIPGTGKGDVRDGDEDFNEHDVRTLYSIYAQDEIDLLNDKLKITPGVKYLYANTKNCDDASFEVSIPGGACDSDTAHYTSPTVGASYEFLPNTVIYAAYGQNIEFPTIDAFFDNLGEGPDFNQTVPVHLEPEHVTDYEAGLRYSNVPYGFNSALGFYMEDFTDTFITQTNPSTDLSTTTNGGASRYQGIELQLAEDFGEQYVNHVDLGDFTGYMNYSYNSAIFTNSFDISEVGSSGSDSGEVTKGQPVALVPQDVVHFGGTWSHAGWAANADASYVTSQFINQATSGTPSSLKEPAYFLLNLGVHKTIPVRLGQATSLVIGFNVDNVLNRQYDAFAFSDTTSAASVLGPKGTNFASILPAAPRAFYGSLTLKF